MHVTKLPLAYHFRVGSARQRPTGNSALHRTSSDPELQRMIQQVQDVLPDIPAAVILEDLGMTIRRDTSNKLVYEDLSM